MDMEESARIVIVAAVVIAAVVVVNDKIDSTGSAWSPTGADLLKLLLPVLALGAIIIVIIVVCKIRDIGGGGV